MKEEETDLKNMMEEAKTLMELYIPIYEDDGETMKLDEMPWDWTEDLQFQYEQDFFDASQVLQ